jgi:hypothetical protein
MKSEMDPAAVTYADEIVDSDEFRGRGFPTETILRRPGRSDGSESE